MGAGDDMGEEGDADLPGDSVDSLPEGVWSVVGYGYTFHVQGERADIFETSGLSCLLVQSLPSQALLPALFTEVTWEGPELVARVAGSVGLYRLAQEDQLNPLCEQGGTPALGDPGYQFDPVFTFDVMWQIFEDNYPFFAERGVDWEAVRTELRPQISADSSQEALFELFTQALGRLHDGHVSLTTEDGFFDSGPLPLLTQAQQEFEAQGGGGSLDDYVLQELLRYLGAVEPLLAEAPRGELGELTWAHVDSEIGYMRMLDFAPAQEAARLAMFDQALSDLSDTDTLLVDLRVNTGGEDSLSFSMLSRFAPARTLALTKAAFFQGDLLPESSAFIEPLPQGPTYTGQVVILVSDNTVSAAEVFALAGRELERVVILGQPSQGILSDVFSRTLPNGWELGLSHELYLSPSGESFEALGIPPDVPLQAPPFSLADREAGRDSGLEEAIALVRQGL